MTKQHKILFVAHGPNQVNGPNIWLQRLLPMLKESGWEPVLIMFMTSDAKCGIADYFERRGISVEREMWAYTEDQIGTIFAHVQRLRPVAFVPNLNVAAYYASKWIRQAGIPTIGMIHSDDRFHEELFNRFACGSEDRHLSVLCVVSEGQFKCLENNSRLNTKLRLLSYGAPVPEMNAIYSSAPYRFVYAGRLEVKQKQVCEMLAGMISVLNKHANAEFYICGDGSARPVLQAEIVQANLEDRIRLLGNLKSEDLETVYLNCQSFVLLSDYEGLPIALQEAMAAGLVPICLRSCNGCAELVADGFSGFLVNDRSEDMLRVASSLIESEELWDRLSAQARLKIANGYSSESNAKAWCELLTELSTGSIVKSHGRLDLPESFELPLPLPSPDGLSREDRRRPTVQANSAPATNSHPAFLSPELDVNNADLYLVRSSILNAVKKHVEDFNGVFLDIGCGVMPYRSLIEPRVDRYLGLDIETDIYRAGVDLRWDGQRIPLADNSVDSAMATEVLEHCPEPLEVLREAKRVLKPGGVFFFTVPYIWPLHDAPYDFYRYTPFSLEKLLGEAGFDSIDIQGLGGWNASLAQMMGLWLKRSPMASEQRMEMAKKLWPLYSELVKNDVLPDDPKAGNTMVTGWSGSARVPVITRAQASPLLDIPLCIVRALPHAYSETFIDDHIRGLSRQTKVIHGFPTPGWDEAKQFILGKDVGKQLNAIKDSQAWMEVYSSALAAYFKANRFKVVLAETSVMGVRIYRACRLAGIPLVVHLHGSDAFQHSILDQIRGDLPGLFETAAAIVVVSEAMKKQVTELGAPSDKVVLSPYGVNVRVDKLAEPENSDPTFIAVGRFVPKKAPNKTIEAFAPIAKAHPNARLVMIGDGPLWDECKRLSVRLGLEDRIEFAGVCSREEVSLRMAAARCFVQHSITPESGDSEGLPLSILEAGAHGLPVISTRHAGIPDAVREELDGFLVDEGDVKGMSRAMERIAKDAAVAHSLGKSYRQRVENLFSHEVSLGRLQRVLEKVVSSMSLVESGSLVAAKLWKKGPSQEEARGDWLSRIIGHDRNFRPAYLELAKLLSEGGEFSEAYLVLSEGLRVGPAHPTLKASLDALRSHLPENDELISGYEQMAGCIPVELTDKPRRILVVTNLFPPQELGGYGRTMWEFCDLLRKRGHSVSVLASDSPELHRDSNDEGTNLEDVVDRSLRLAGGWENGKAIAHDDESQVEAIHIRNARMILRKSKSFNPDVCLLGNIDFLGWQGMDALIEGNIPVVHRLGNEFPGYPLSATPQSSLYCMAGNTQWMNKRLQEHGYRCPRFEVVFPGSPIEWYFRAFAPDRSCLRLAYASIVGQFKGIHVLVESLSHLKRMGVPFRCEIAGDQVDTELLEKLKEFLAHHELSDCVDFIGFQDKAGLASLFARSNVLVFPSVFEEPFGKTQIEAMAAGLLVVSSGTGGTREIVQHGENGLVFESGNAESLAAELKSLVDNEDRWRQLAANGQSSAFNFTTKRSVDKLEEIFDSLLERE